MPHITLEYTQDTISPSRLQALLDGLYAVIRDSGLFDESHIKLRSLGHEHYRLGNAGKGFLHVSCRIHEGRSEVQREALSRSVVDWLVMQKTGVSVITCEVVEMCQDGYSKWKAS